MKALCLLWFLVVLAGCSTHQDLKAPYETGRMVPVLDQWDGEDSEHG